MQIYHVLFIHSSGDGDLNYFQFLVIMNTDAVNICVFVWTYIYICLGQITKSGIVDSYGNSVFHFFKETTNLFQSGCTIIHSTLIHSGISEGSPVSPSLPTLVIVFLFCCSI